LKPTTALSLLNVATSRGSCWVVTKNLSPSAHGGVVREPVYEWNDWLTRAWTGGLKASAPVSATVPGIEI